MKTTKIVTVLAILFLATGCFAQQTPSIPKLQPFGSGAKTSGTQKAPLNDQEVLAALERNIVKSGQRTGLAIPLEQFNQKLANAGLLSFNFVNDPKNTIYIFTDGKCSLSAKAYMQIREQKPLFQAHKINVKWIPIVQDGDPHLYQKSTHLFVDDMQYQDTTPNQIRQLIQNNTELFATTFKSVATPLVFWPTSDGSYEFLLGYVKPKKVNSFLANVEKGGTFLDYLYSMTPQGQKK